MYRVEHNTYKTKFFLKITPFFKKNDEVTTILLTTRSNCAPVLCLFIKILGDANHYVLR